MNFQTLSKSTFSVFAIRVLSSGSNAQLNALFSEHWEHVKCLSQNVNFHTSQIYKIFCNVKIQIFLFCYVFCLDHSSFRAHVQENLSTVPTYTTHITNGFLFSSWYRCVSIIVQSYWFVFFFQLKQNLQTFWFISIL